MGRSAFCVAALLAVAAIGPACGQPVVLPAPPGYPLSSPAPDSPLQQQILRNYRSDLQQTQRELSTRNPSGLSREQVDLMHQLNTVNSALTPVPASPPTLPATPQAAPQAAPFR